MNEITKIHLGRQPFVIAVDAHKLLQEYLHDIKHQVGKSSESVIDEVEMRMAELLTERGVKGDKVILTEDISYLKEQLGSPSDFKDDDTADDDAAKPSEDQAEPTKRLFRDTEHGMLAGVSSGLAAYFGIDVVIIRILFLIAAVSGGWGIPIYIVMWLVIPEAKTASEQLQMRGKAVTVDSLKEIVDRADVTGAAHRASRTAVAIIAVVLKVILGIVGATIAIIAVGLLAAISMAGVYALLHNGHLIHGALLFPLGTTETVATVGGLGIAASLAAFILAAGVAMLRRKWSVPGWGVAALSALLLISLIACGAAMPDAVQNVRDRYQVNSHTETRSLQPFHSVRFQQGRAPIDIEYNYDDSYKVEVRYLGNIKMSDVKTTVQNDTLIVDTKDFKPGPDWDCDGLCVGVRDNFRIVIHAPESARSTLEPVPQLPKTPDLP